MTRNRRRSWRCEAVGTDRILRSIVVQCGVQAHDSCVTKCSRKIVNHWQTSHAMEQIRLCATRTRYFALANPTASLSRSNTV